MHNTVLLLFLVGCLSEETSDFQQANCTSPPIVGGIPLPGATCQPAYNLADATRNAAAQEGNQLHVMLRSPAPAVVCRAFVDLGGIFQRSCELDWWYDDENFLRTTCQYGATFCRFALCSSFDGIEHCNDLTISPP